MKKRQGKMKKQAEKGGGSPARLDLAGFLFPRRCPICHDVVEERNARVCAICRVRLPYIREPFCQKCGKPLLSEEQEYCADCSRKKHWFEQGRAPFIYDDTMRDSIAGYKYKGRKEYAGFYAEEILRRCAKQMLSWGGQALIPVPLHPSRKRKRGFNQAELLARELSKRSGLPVDKRRLVRTKRTHAQKSLDSRERLENVKDAFRARGGRIPYERVILVDDIYTTGSTMDAAARALKENGVRKVYFVCICTGAGW